MDKKYGGIFGKNLLFSEVAIELDDYLAGKSVGLKKTEILAEMIEESLEEFRRFPSYLQTGYLEQGLVRALVQDNPALGKDISAFQREFEETYRKLKEFQSLPIEEQSGLRDVVLRILDSCLSERAKEESWRIPYGSPYRKGLVA